MVKTLPIAVRTAIRASILNNEPLDEIATRYQCSIQTVRHHKRSIKSLVETGVDLRKKAGRKRKISVGLFEAIEQFVEKHPIAYVYEIQAFLREEHDLVIHITTLNKALEGLKLTRKLVNQFASQREDELRAYWLLKLSNWTAGQLIFLEESGVGGRSDYRRYGWAPVGMELQVADELKRSTRWSILPAYSCQGYLKSRIFQGSITKDVYQEFFLNEVLPICTPFPGPRSVIVMDNASVHGGLEGAVAQACRKAGVLLEFLPPCSPDFNPLQESFKDLKESIKRNYDRIKEFQNFGEFLRSAMYEVGGEKEAFGHFGQCKIIV